MKSSLALLNRMPKSEGEPVSITINHPSLGDFKRIYTKATRHPNRWLTCLWSKDQKERVTFDVGNPYREIRGSRQRKILQMLSPEPDDEGEFLDAAINIYEMPRDEVAAKKTTGENRRED